jgi:hypothetical protein
MSTRSIQKPRRTDPGSVTPDITVRHAAAAAASRAMRSSQSSSQEPRASYDRLGGPANIAVPRRRPGSSLRATDDNTSVRHGDSSTFSTPCQLKKLAGASAQSNRIDDPAALPPITEFNGLDGRNSSVPSSYRRLHKAKSMFSARQRASQTPYGVPPLPCGDPSDPERSPGFQMPRTMRRSKSFLRGNSQSQQPGINFGAHEAAFQLARSQFTNERDGAETQHRLPSFLLKRKKQHKPFRKSFRATSEGAAPVTEQNTELSDLTSRSISSSIKSRLKRVFGFSKTAEQHAASQSSANCDDNFAVARIEQDTAKCLPHVNPMTECCTTATSFRKVSQSPSRDSLCTSKSRVTSWADSTMANTVTARKPGHRQSLSLIREDGGGLNQQTPRTPAVVESQNRRETILRSSPQHIGIVDSQDLYYALMQQMGHNALPDPSEEMVFGTVPEHRAIPERSNTAYSQHSRRTIRPVSSMESSPSPGSFTTARCGDQSSPYKPYTRSVKSMQPSRGISAQATYQNMPTGFDQRTSRSAFVVDGDSDEDNRSVIIARFDESRRNVISPSIYSRTTGGNTPVKADIADILDMDVHDRPGTATIFASQRTAYSSPRRPGRASSSRLNANPSADWQKWMSSQIDRIEQASPTREHIREDAQFQDDDEDLTNIARHTLITSPASPLGMFNTSGSNGHTQCGTLIEKRLPSQSNFSRPFGQFSSIQPILPLQAAKLDDAVEKNLGRSSKDLVVNSNETISPQLIPNARTQGLSPIRLRSGNMQPPESPTPNRVATKRSFTKDQQRRYSVRRAPISQDGRASQFRSMRSQRDYRGNNENQKQQDEYGDMMESYHQLQDVHSTISSKRMVDIFLDSRRRQMGDSTDNKAATEAFL